MVRLRKRHLKAFLGFLICVVIYVLRKLSEEDDISSQSEFKIQKESNNYIQDSQCALPVQSFQDFESSQCALPILDPFNEQIMKFITKEVIQIRCPGKRYTSYKNGVLTITDKDRSIKNIQVQSILRKPHSDWEFTLKTKDLNYPQTSSSRIGEEFLRIDLNSAAGEKIVEFHAEVVPKLDVLQRKVSNKGLKLNVLMVGFDSTSAAQMQRAMPEVYKFLKDELSSYIFQGFSIVGDGTTPQLTAMLTGHTEAELPEARRGYDNSDTVDSWPWIFKEYHNHGYATLYSEDDAFLNSFNYRLYGFKEPPTDHYSRPFWIAAPTEGYCVKTTPQIEMHFSYIESFLKAYKDIPRFGFAFLSSVSHGNMNTLKPAQEYVLQFFKSIRQKGFLEDTMLVVFSDHGLRYGDARIAIQSKLEERLPFLSITLPKHARENYPELDSALKKNALKLTSHFDIHATLRHVLGYPSAQAYSARPGMSLFTQIPDARSCADCGIPEHYCPCVKLKEISTNHQHITTAAKNLLDHINGIINGDKLASEKCRKLKLVEIKTAYQALNHPKLIKFLRSKDIHGRIPEFDNNATVSDCNYHLIIRTAPGDALFEASFQLFEGKVHFKKDISRINQYGDQPSCIAVERPYFRKFCFCKPN